MVGHFRPPRSGSLGEQGGCVATGEFVGGRKWLGGVGEPTRPRVQAAAAGTLQVSPGRPPVTGRFCENRPQLPLLLREEVCTLCILVLVTQQKQLKLKQSKTIKQLQNI